jgi:hypothetical protein
VTYSERLDRFDELVGEARARSDADQALVGLLSDGVFDSLSRLQVVAALGDTTGATGSSALRKEFINARAEFDTTKRHNRAAYCDLMCASVWALGKRDGAAATDILLEASEHANPSVRGYGLHILAAVGDDRAWDDMFAGLAGRLAKKVTSAQRGGEAAHVVEYLARYCSRSSERSARLAALLRDRWRRLPDATATRLAEMYPGVGPGGPTPSEIDFATYVPRAPWQVPPMAQPNWERQSSSDAYEFSYPGEHDMPCIDRDVPRRHLLQ